MTPAYDIYWNTFTDTERLQSKDLGYPSAGTMPCIARGFAQLVSPPSQWPYIIEESEIEAAAEQIVDVYQRFGDDFVDAWTTLERALAHIERAGNSTYPGAWAPTLKYLLLEAVRGISAARAYLDNPADKIGTIYERKQLEWLRGTPPVRINARRAATTRLLTPCSRNGAISPKQTSKVGPCSRISLSLQRRRSAERRA